METIFEEQYEFINLETSKRTPKIHKGSVRVTRGNDNKNSFLTIPSEDSRELWAKGFRSVHLAYGKITDTLSLVFVKRSDGAQLCARKNRSKTECSTITVYNAAMLSYICDHFHIAEGEVREFKLGENQSVRDDIIFRRLEISKE